MPKNDTTKLHFLILVLAIASGALAGIVASVVTQQSLVEYAQSLTNGQLISISEPKPQPLPGTYEEALARVQDSGWTATAFIRSVSVESDEAAEWITRDSAVGHGSVVTSDGWILFHKGAVEKFQNPATQAEIWIANERYAIESVVRDTFTDFVLVKINGNGLPALAFANSDTFTGGEFLFAVTSDREIIPTSLKDAEESVNGIVNPAEVYATEWEVEAELAAPAPLLNAAGELVAFGREGNRATPLHHLRPFIQSVLRFGEPRYAGLGVHVASVSDILNVSIDITNQVGLDGAIVAAPDRFSRAVVLNSPAAESGIESGDVIIAVDDVPVANHVSLDELLKTYEPGDQATVALVRAGEELEFEVTFVDASDLIY